ncbi:uncharacterized protein LOC110612720 isoform X2 [Manihot esculenta]|uniref:Uncharacterized protein n=1 Tax=Manihot esculenta TaxID=3983 RepID=A0ACB7HSN7_MANES|nr:uncharacterized protein LOC110612720 isoform X2 [Manihot esculenta]KAG8655320.1 hypothetical protein MANES_04G027600v8 [Manihot esculenta]
MLQRQSSSSRAPDGEHFTTQPIQQQAIYSPRNLRVYTSGGRLPLYFRPYNPLRRDYRETLRARLASEKLVHLIPVVLLLCLFILWWFSYPVNLIIKDGKIVEVQPVEMPPPFR